MVKVPKDTKNTTKDNDTISSSNTSNQPSHDSETSRKKFYIETIAKFCDKCGSGYTPANVTVVQESNFSSIIHFSCFNCKSNHIATYVKPMGMSSRVPVNTDLSVEEISKFAKLNGVTSNEVLDIYELLEKEDTVKSF